MTDDTNPNPGPGYGHKSREGGPGYPPPAVANGTKPLDRTKVAAAQNRVRAYLAARADVIPVPGTVVTDHIHGFTNVDGIEHNLLASDLQLLLGADYWLGDGAPPDTELATRDDWEVHESFGFARVSNVSSSGSTLFDSDISHQHFITLSIGRMTRRRELNRDWLMAREELVEVAFSVAQWGALVSSFNQGSGVPCTIMHTQEQGLVPSAPHLPRLAYSVQEVHDSADKALANLQEAVKAVLEGFDANTGRKEMRALLRHLDIVLGNTVPTMTFTADSLTEHVEKVMAKARADVEAMVDDRARLLGIDPAVVISGLLPVTPVPELGAGDISEGSEFTWMDDEVPPAE